MNFKELTLEKAEAWFCEELNFHGWRAYRSEAFKFLYRIGLVVLPPSNVNSWIFPLRIEVGPAFHQYRKIYLQMNRLVGRVTLLKISPLASVNAKIVSQFIDYMNKNFLNSFKRPSPLILITVDNSGDLSGDNYGLLIRKFERPRMLICKVCRRSFLFDENWRGFFCQKCESAFFKKEFIRLGVMKNYCRVSQINSLEKREGKMERISSEVIRRRPEK